MKHLKTKCLKSLVNDRIKCGYLTSRHKSFEKEEIVYVRQAAQGTVLINS